MARPQAGRGNEKPRLPHRRAGRSWIGSTRLATGSENAMAEITIRPLEQADHADWRRLWTAYLEFYEATVPEEVYATT